MMIFKELNLENLDEVLGLYVESFNAPPWNDKWTEEIVKKRLKQMLSCEGSYGLVCFEDTKAVGMILGNHEYSYDCMDFQIKEFCVDHNEKGKGIGKRLLEKFSNNLSYRGIENIYLYTSRTDKTEGFYVKNGYKVVDDMIMMDKNITKDI
ncbi:MAG: GNAT family N-acetyltransferase [Clostridium sp.]